MRFIKTHFARNARLRVLSAVSHESGQATSEYMLMLMIVVSLVLVAMNRVLRPMMERFTQQVEKNLEDRFFKEDSFHQLNL